MLYSFLKLARKAPKTDAVKFDSENRIRTMSHSHYVTYVRPDPGDRGPVRSGPGIDHDHRRRQSGVPRDVPLISGEDVAGDLGEKFADDRFVETSGTRDLAAQGFKGPIRISG
jgi:hypothetical protein